MKKKIAKGASEGAGTVVLGTYDGAIIGLRADTGAQIFGYAPHAGCVKAVSCSKSGRLASGGSDHSVRLFDLAKGVEIGELQEHDDTVCSLDFWGASSFVTGGVDGQVCIWRCSDWELLLKFRGHKSALVDLAVHPSGRMMASAGRDSSVRLWDLTRGTSAALVSSEDVFETIFWSPQGTRLAALSPKLLQVVDAQSGAVGSYRDPNSGGFLRVTLSAAMFLREGEVILGDAKGFLRVVAFKKGAGEQGELVEVCRLQDDDARVRIKSLARASEGGELKRGDSMTFALGTSSGRVEIWRFTAPAPSNAASADHFRRLRVVDTATRLTCMTFWHGDAHAARLTNPLEIDDDMDFEEGEEDEELGEGDEEEEDDVAEEEVKEDPRLKKFRRK